jgi:plastocyanin
VVWTNVDGVPHTVTFGSQGVAEDGFNSGYIVPGQSFAFKFDQPGEYRYTCTLHPSMNGEITVY